MEIACSPLTLIMEIAPSAKGVAIAAIVSFISAPAASLKYFIIKQSEEKDFFKDWEHACYILLWICVFISMSPYSMIIKKTHVNAYRFTLLFKEIQSKLYKKNDN